MGMRSSQNDRIRFFGPVCKGTRETAFSGYNGQNFGDLVCKKLGFKKSDFIGNNKEYNDFLIGKQIRNEKIIANNGTSIPCFPEYFIAGGTCEKKSKSLDDCQFNFYYRDHGTCLERMSDIFIHCQTEVTEPVQGKWSKWTGDSSYCPSSGKSIFYQKLRECVGSKTDMNPMCKGSFLELHKCPNCGIEYDDQDYNYHENYGSSSDSYDYDSFSSSNPSYSSSSSSNSARRKRAIDDTCDCNLNLKWEDPVKKRFNWGEWEVWDKCSKTCERKRTRRCLLDGQIATIDSCNGKKIQIEPCNTHDCPITSTVPPSPVTTPSSSNLGLKKLKDYVTSKQYELRKPKNGKRPSRRALRGFKESKVESLDACKLECDNNDFCKAFSFFPQRTSKNCFMKGKLGKKQYYPADEFIFAVKNPYADKLNFPKSPPTPKTTTKKPSVTVTQSPSNPCCEGEIIDGYISTGCFELRNDKKGGRRLRQVGQSYKVKTLEECKRKCDKKDLCSGFSFFPERVSKNCYLKARMLKDIYLAGSSEKFTFAQKVPLLKSFNMTTNCERPRGEKEIKFRRKQ